MESHSFVEESTELRHVSGHSACVLGDSRERRHPANRIRPAEHVDTRTATRKTLGSELNLKRAFPQQAKSETEKRVFCQVL